MNWKWIRQLHRWMSITFTVFAIAITVIVLSQEETPAWVYLSPLLPLTLLLLTGLNLFALPYISKWRSGRRNMRTK